MLAALSLVQFERGTGGRINRHQPVGRAEHGRAQGNANALLAIADIGHHSAQRRARGTRQGRWIERAGGKRGAQDAERGFAVKALVGREMSNFGKAGRKQMPLDQRCLGGGRKDQFGRADAGQFVLHLLGAQIGGKALAGRHIGPGQREIGFAVPHHGKRGEKIGGARVEVIVFGQRASCDQAHDFAFDHRFGAALFGFGGVFHLLADGDAMAQLDQLVEIVIGRMDRHAAHADVFAQMLAALGQHDAQSRAGDLGVLEEQLVEIAHAIEQQIARIDRLDLEILRHHRGQRGAGRGGRRLVGRRRLIH